MNNCKDTIKEPTKKVAWINLNNDYADEVEVNLNDYELILKGDKTIFKKKTPVYPKTYKECCKVLFDDESYSEYTFIPAKVERHTFMGDKIINLPPILMPYENELRQLHILSVCRNAYWKLADNWEPNFKDDNFKYAVYYHADELQTNVVVTQENKFLVFPTLEMQVQFVENFKDIIEKCKFIL